MEAQGVTLAELIQRATGGQHFEPRLLFRPSLVYPVLCDPFWIWCEYHAPPEEALDETSRYEEMRLERGREFERAWLRENYPLALKVEPDFGFQALVNTLEALLRGVPVIYQPQLWDLTRQSYGKSDLLVRDDSHRSDLGSFHYRLVEIKRSWSLKDYHILQAAFYNGMLGKIQGYLPREVTIVLKDANETVSCSETEKELNEVLSKWKALRDGELLPEPGRPPKVTRSPWRVYGNKWVEARKDLVLLAGVDRGDREKLRAAGIHRIDQLWNLTLEEVRRILGEQNGTTAYFLARAYKEGRPILKPGSRLSIPRAKRLLYFDFETSDDVHPREPPHVYLIGCWDARRDQYVRFLARGAQDERRIFEEFLDYVGDLHDTVLYHWTDFELRVMRKVIQRWRFLEGPLEGLMTCCVDLKATIQDAVYLPVPTFSIKSVAPALGFSWRQREIGAYEAMVCYWDYLDGDKTAIEKAILYNEDDCLAMWHVDQELAKL